MARIDSELFGPALTLLADAEERGMPCTAPLKWTDYREAHGLDSRRTTAAAISLQDRSGLRAELAEAGAMALRVGRGTFRLVRAEQGVDDFFLPSRRPAPDEIVTLSPELSLAEQFLFRTLGAISEINLVQYAAVGGLFGEALGLDTDDLRATPTMMHAAYEFDFRPLKSRPDVVFTYSGQVGIDGVFVAKRGGRAMCFVIEAKRSTHPLSLAKHKLVFALEALAMRLQRSQVASPFGGAELPLVPLYLRAWPARSRTRFEVIECHECYPSALPAIDELSIKDRRFYQI